MKIAISGSTGLIGSRVQELLKDEFEFLPLRQEDGLDITNKDTVWNTLKNLDFDLFLHLAGYTNVDQAEKEKDLAFKINVEGTKNVLEATLQKGKKFINISTDFVFDGTTPPYYEDSKPHPQGAYAKSKLEGENAVGNQGMIIRLAFPYRANYDQRPDFFRAIKKRLEKGEALNMANDSLFTPTFIDDIAQALKYLINNFSPETFHVVGSQSLSPHQAGNLIVDTFRLDKNLIKEISFDEYFKNRAPRPKLSVIKSKKNNFYKMKSFEEGLLEIKRQLPI